MAKEIKAVQCPKCGSTKKVELRKDYFRCLSCDTEYYLENDDITITHNVNYNTPSPVSRVPPPKSTGVVVGIVVFILIGGFIISRIFSTPATRYATSNVNTPEESYTWLDKDMVTYADANGRAMAIVMGQRDYNDDEKAKKSGKYISWLDPLSGREVKTERLTEIPTTSDDRVQFKAFSNGDIYAIVNKRFVFKVNTTDMSLENINPGIAGHYPELATGIASAEFISERYGDGFNLMTNDGNSYYFYPVIERVYTNKDYRQAQTDIMVKDAHAKTKTYFTFNSVGSDYPEEKIRLIRFTQKDNAGGPKDWPWFEVSYHFDAHGEKYKSDFRFGDKMVVTYKDLTPGRTYLSAKILYSDQEYVLLKTSATAADDANSSLQCLNAQTGNIVFTLPFAEKKDFDEDGVRYGKGFIVKTYNEVLLVSLDGKLIKEFKLL